MKNVSQFPDYPGFTSGPASAEHAGRPMMGGTSKKGGGQTKKPSVKNGKNTSKITKL